MQQLWLDILMCLQITLSLMDIMIGHDGYTDVSSNNSVVAGYTDWSSSDSVVDG